MLSRSHNEPSSSSCSKAAFCDHQWEHSNYGEWTKPGHNGCREFKLNMNAGWFHLREELKRAERWERIMRLNQKPMLKEIQYTMDWKPWLFSLRLETKKNTDSFNAHTAANQPLPCTSSGSAKPQTKNVQRLGRRTHLRSTTASTLSFGPKASYSFLAMRSQREAQQSKPGEIGHTRQPSCLHHRHCGHKQGQQAQALCRGLGQSCWPRQ